MLGNCLPSYHLTVIMGHPPVELRKKVPRWPKRCTTLPEFGEIVEFLKCCETWHCSDSIKRNV
jgi:hypothetical protein